jgi:hypothetical protein
VLALLRHWWVKRPKVHIPSTVTPGIKIAGEIDRQRLDKQLLDH